MNESEFILVRIFYLFAIKFFYALIWMCQIIMTVYEWDKRSDYMYFGIWWVMYCVTSVSIHCNCILIVLAAVLKQVVLFVLYIDNGQDLGADLIMGIQYLVFSNGHAIIWGRIDTSYKFNQVPCCRKYTHYILYCSLY